ncbi:MAG: Uma2 family endonuclease [Rubrobacteraceae bacterium]
MAERSTPHQPLSVEEYLALEQDAATKHEYVGGEIHAMVGASRRHNRISGNIFRKLADAAEGGPCRVYISDMKLQIEDVFYYPDVMVACGDVPENEYLEDEPCVVVEVSSPGTETIDRREKLANYQGISSLRAYLIVSQERRRITHYQRDENGVWLRGDLLEEGKVPIPCPPGAVLGLDEVYAGL